MGNLIFFFLQQVEEAFAFWGTPEGDLVHPAAVLETVRRLRVNVDGNVCTVMVTTLVLEPRHGNSLMKFCNLRNIGM
ncbi:unnamed protein product [Prunus armeniaca]